MRMTSRNVTWQPTNVDRSRRWNTLGQRGVTVWFTGLPAAGKSTIAAAVEERLVERGRWTYVLDGDNLRHGVCGDLGFTPQERSENVRRVAEVARLFADAGAVALVSLVSPYATDREQARALHELDGLPFLEVFANTSLGECRRRDPKGLYTRAADGEIHGFTGVDDPYEPPLAPDVELSEQHSLAAAAEAVLTALDALPR
jgi:adenylyl-sulfate kinase